MKPKYSKEQVTQLLLDTAAALKADPAFNLTEEAMAALDRKVSLLTSDEAMEDTRILFSALDTDNDLVKKFVLDFFSKKDIGN